MQLAFYKASGKWHDRVVRFVTRSPYSHVELAVEQAPDGRWVCMSSSPRDGGVRVKTMALPGDRWDLMDVGGNKAAAWAWINAHEGERYDWLGVARFLFPMLGQSRSRWFCSEAALAAAGLLETWRFSPADVAALAPSLVTR